MLLFLAAAAATVPQLLVTSADGPEGLALASAILRAGRSNVTVAVGNASSSAASKLAALGAAVRESSSPSRPSDFEGVACALLLAPLTADRQKQGEAMIAAASAANVTSVLLLSVAGAEIPGAPASLSAYRALELELASSWPRAEGRSYVILRTLFYQQNLDLWSADVRARAELRLPLAGGQSIAPLFEDDVAAVTSRLALAPQLPTRFARRTLQLTGPRLLSGSQLASSASTAVGSRIRYSTVPRSTATQILLSSGALDASEATLLLDLLAWQSHVVTRPSGDVAAVTGVAATDVDRFFEAAAADFRNDGVVLSTGDRCLNATAHAEGAPVEMGVDNVCPQLWELRAPLPPPSAPSVSTERAGRAARINGTIWVTSRAGGALCLSAENCTAGARLLLRAAVTPALRATCMALEGGRIVSHACGLCADPEGGEAEVRLASCVRIGTPFRALNA